MGDARREIAAADQSSTHPHARRSAPDTSRPGPHGIAHAGNTCAFPCTRTGHFSTRRMLAPWIARFAPWIASRGESSRRRALRGAMGGSVDARGSATMLVLTHRACRRRDRRVLRDAEAKHAPLDGAPCCRACPAAPRFLPLTLVVGASLDGNPFALSMRECVVHLRRGRRTCRRAPPLARPRKACNQHNYFPGQRTTCTP